MFEEKYKHLNNQVKPGESLINSTIHSIEEYKKKASGTAFLLRKRILVLVSICLCILLVTPALAANVDPIYQLMYMVSPSVAQLFMPVQKSVENNGIKMEVVSAYIHENMAEIYITMQDLTGNRIDSTTDLYDSYSINRPFDSSAHCELIGYEDDTKTATFLITIDGWGNNNISGDKITFSVLEFLSHKKVYVDISLPIDLNDVSVTENTQTISAIIGGGGRDYESYIDFENDPIALITSSPMSKFTVEGIELTGIGYVNGKLHIQTAIKDRLDNGNHGYFYLKDDDGNVVDCSYNFYFPDQYSQLNRIDYCEYVFDISLDDLTEYTLYGYFVTSGMKTEGNWRVTFPLEKLDNKD